MSDALASFPERLASAARAAVGRPVADGEWTPELVVRHLIAVEADVHQARLRDLATTDRPEWSWTEPGPWTGESELGLDGVLERFAAARDETLATLRSLDARAGRGSGTTRPSASSTWRDSSRTRSTTTRSTWPVCEPVEPPTGHAVTRAVRCGPVGSGVVPGVVRHPIDSDMASSAVG